MLFFEKLFGRGKPAFVPELSDRAAPDVSRDLIPRRLDRIMRSANDGDTEDQCRLCRELLEKNTDIAQAVRTRVDAVSGCAWTLEAGDDTPAAKEAAEALEKELRGIDGTEDADTFEEMIEDLMGALLPGFAVCEILWRDGGHVAGFKAIEQHHFSLMDGYYPRLVTTDHPSGFEIPRDRILYHRLRFHGGDPARGGLIRPLAWLHCFGNLNEKNLLAFAERYGMPFLIIKADEETYQRERTNIKNLIRNFGSSGGGIFTKGVEQELLQAANAEGNIYFRLKEALANSVNQLVLGQTASSGDSAGLSKGDAQSKVRQDILESDCRRVARTINAQLCIPWAQYNYGANVPAPRFSLDCAAPEDKLATAQTLQALAQAGLRVKPEEASERFGFTFERMPDPAAGGFGGFGGFGLPSEPSAPAAPAATDDTLNLKQKYDAMGVAIRAGLLTATPEIEAQTRAELGLPVMSDEVQKAWQATGGIRQPITLKTAEAAAVADALNVDENDPGKKAPMSDAANQKKNDPPGDPSAVEPRFVRVGFEEMYNGGPAAADKKKTDPPGGLEKEWLGKFSEEFSDLINNADLTEKEFHDRLDRLIAEPPIDPEVFAAAAQRELAAGVIAGMRQARRNLKPEQV